MFKVVGLKVNGSTFDVRSCAAIGRLCYPLAYPCGLRIAVKKTRDDQYNVSNRVLKASKFEVVSCYFP